MKKFKLQKNKRYVKAVLSISVIASLYAFYSHDYEYKETYEVIDDEAFTRYDDGLIYIGDESYIESINPSEGDVLVVDERDSVDSNFKIIDSYKITDKDTRNDIIEAILEYNRMYPMVYERSVESMRLEWLAHNILYNLNYEVDRTRDVDFEVSEENTYNNKSLIKLFRL